MPFYIGEDMPEFESYQDWEERKYEAEKIGKPIADDALQTQMFKYILPFASESVSASFSPIVGPKPPAPKWPSYEGLLPQRPGLLERMFGWRSQASIREAQRRKNESMAAFQNSQEMHLALSQWELSNSAQLCRQAGVRRVFGAYDGGNDESFTHLRGAELKSGERVDRKEAASSLPWQAMETVVEKAVDLTMGSYGAGAFALRGLLTIDVEACVVTDEQNRDLVFEG